MDVATISSVQLVVNSLLSGVRLMTEYAVAVAAEEPVPDHNEGEEFAIPAEPVLQGQVNGAWFTRTLGENQLRELQPHILRHVRRQV